MLRRTQKWLPAFCGRHVKEKQNTMLWVTELPWKSVLPNTQFSIPGIIGPPTDGARFCLTGVYMCASLYVHTHVCTLGEWRKSLDCFLAFIYQFLNVYQTMMTAMGYISDDSLMIALKSVRSAIRPPNAESHLWKGKVGKLLASLSLSSLEEDARVPTPKGY